MSKVTVEINCRKCHGTGLYMGMAERDGAAVICWSCKGEGSELFSYSPFEGRVRRDNVKRVFKTSAGYVHSSKNCQGVKFEDAGCTYQEWLSGVKPKPVKDLYCPYLYVEQEIQNRDHSHHFMNERCQIEIGHGKHGAGSRITECRQYSNKKECWKIFETVPEK